MIFSGVRSLLRSRSQGMLWRKGLVSLRLVSFSHGTPQLALFKLVELYLVRPCVFVDVDDGTCSERGVLHALAFGEARLAYEPRYASIREVVGSACLGKPFVGRFVGEIDGCRVDVKQETRGKAWYAVVVASLGFAEVESAVACARSGRERNASSSMACMVSVLRQGDNSFWLMLQMDQWGSSSTLSPHEWS